METLTTDENIENKKRRLHTLINNKAHLHRKPNEPPFKLASGGTTDHYFDIKIATQSPVGIAIIADIIYDMIKDYDISSVGGLESSAIAIASSTAQLSYYQSRQIPAFWVRKERKTHGTQRLIEGYLFPNSNVVIIDDVTTKGSSVEKAVKAVRDEGCEVQEIITVVDREEGAAEKFKNLKIPFRWVFKKSDFEEN